MEATASPREGRIRERRPERARLKSLRVAVLSLQVLESQRVASSAASSKAVFDSRRRPQRLLWSRASGPCPHSPPDTGRSRAVRVIRSVAASGSGEALPTKLNRWCVATTKPRKEACNRHWQRHTSGAERRPHAWMDCLPGLRRGVLLRGLAGLLFPKSSLVLAGGCVSTGLFDRPYAAIPQI